MSGYLDAKSYSILKLITTIQSTQVAIRIIINGILPVQNDYETPKKARKGVASLWYATCFMNQFNYHELLQHIVYTTHH